MDNIRWLRKGCGVGEEPPVGRTNTTVRLQALRSPRQLVMICHPAQQPSRKEMAKKGLAGYVVPSTDAHQVPVETYFTRIFAALWPLRP